MESRYGSVANSGRKLKQLFAEIDINGDGKLTFGEFKEGLAALKVIEWLPLTFQYFYSPSLWPSAGAIQK